MILSKLFNFDKFWSNYEKNSYQDSIENFFWLEFEKDLKSENDVFSMRRCVFTFETKTSSSITWFDFVRKIIR
jgi:hypothetical protein